MVRSTVSVFLSHSSRDKPFVRLVGEDIRACEVGIWIDEAELEVGDSLPVRLRQAIESASFAAVFVSPISVHSRWVAEEIGIARQVEVLRGRTCLLPILVPGLTDEEIPPSLEEHLWADFRPPPRYDHAFRLLLRRVNPRALPVPERLCYGLTLNASRKERLVAAGQASALRPWVLEYLSAGIQTWQDPTERYWAYIALGELGGFEAAAQLEAGKADPNPFAQSGAIKGLDMVRETLDISTGGER